MCLAIPMKVVKIDGDEGTVETRGLKRKVNLSFLKDLRLGDYIIVHAGFAIEKLKENEAKETLNIFKGII